MAEKGGVDSQPIGGFKAAMAQYQKRASSTNQGSAAKGAPKGGASTGKPNASTNDNGNANANANDSGSGDGKNALFASINSGQSLTSGLNKVTSDMKTKNRKDRSGKVPSGTGNDNKKAAPSYKSKQESKEADKDPEIKIMGGTIRVSYYKKMSKLMVFGSSADDPNEKKDDPYTPEDMKIYDQNAIDLKKELEFWNCDHAMFRISKKCKAVKLYNCKNVQISIKAVVSTVEVTNCEKCTLFIKEKAPSLVLEKCDGVKLWLEEAAAASDPAPQLFTTLTQNTELNVSKGQDQDPLAVPVPSQFVTTLEDGKWQTKPVEHV